MTICRKQIGYHGNGHAITEELWEAVFSTFRAAVVATQRHGKHVSGEINQHWTIEELLKTVFSKWFVPEGYWWNKFSAPPFGGGVEYFHRSPASRRRRRKGKSRISDSTIWSRVPRDSDPRINALARASSNGKRQTRLLVRESAHINKPATVW
jgi:hypothetical protein